MAGFEAMITVDQKLPLQRTRASRSLSIIVLRGRTTNIDDLLTLVPTLLDAFRTLGAGEVRLVGC